MRDHVRAILEQVRLEADFADDRVGIEADSRRVGAISFATPKWIYPGGSVRLGVGGVGEALRWWLNGGIVITVMATSPRRFATIRVCGPVRSSRIRVESSRDRRGLSAGRHRPCSGVSLAFGLTVLPDGVGPALFGPGEIE